MKPIIIILSGDPDNLACQINQKLTEGYLISYESLTPYQNQLAVIMSLYDCPDSRQRFPDSFT